MGVIYFFGKCIFLASFKKILNSYTGNGWRARTSARQELATLVFAENPHTKRFPPGARRAAARGALIRPPYLLTVRPKVTWRFLDSATDRYLEKILQLKSPLLQNGT